MDSALDQGASWKDTAAQEPDKPGLLIFDQRLRSQEELQAYNQLPNFFRFSADEGSAIDIQILGVCSKWFGVWRLSSPSGFRATARLDGIEDMAVIQMPRSGHVQHGASQGEPEPEPGSQPIGSNSGRIARHSDMQDLRFSAGYDSVECAVLMEPLLAEMRASSTNGMARFTEFEPEADLSAPALRSFQHNILATIDRLSKAKDGTADVLVAELLIHHLLGAWPRRWLEDRTPRPASSRHIQRSLDFIEANLALPISVAEIAAAAGIGIRALQASFRKDLGRSPIQHMIERRLDRVHEELRRGGSTAISTIASRWGFIHMSDFSRRYRQRFGCTPSETQIKASHRG